MREEIIQDLIRDEGMVCERYPCPAGKPTIGVGRNLESPGLSQEEADMIGSDFPDEISEEEAMILLNNDIDRVEEELLDVLPWTQELDDARLQALINMSFQLGLPTLLSFTRTLGHMKQGLWDAASKEMLDSQWARQTPARAERQSERIRTGEV